MQLSRVQYLPVAPILGAAGFSSPMLLPVPADTTQLSWSSLTNATGLVAGVTTLGDDLSLLYRQNQIAGSASAAILTWTWTWTCTAFAPV